MAIAFIASNVGQGSSVTSLTVTKPTGTTDGDILFGVVIQANGFATTVPTGWTSLGQHTQSNFNAELFYKVASSEGADYQWLFSAAAGKGRALVVTYRGGFDTADPIDVVSNTDYITDDTSCRAASMTVSVANSALLFFGNVSNLSSITFTKPSVPTSDWVEDFDAGSTTPDMWNEVCSMIWSSSGATGIMDSTMSTNTTVKHAFAVALNPVPSAIKTVNGLAKASVKTVNGLAIASVKTINDLV